MKKRFAAVVMAAAFLAGCGARNGDGLPTDVYAENGTQTETDSGEEIAADIGRLNFIETEMNLNGREIVMMSFQHHLFNYWEGDMDRTHNDTLRVMEILREIEQDYNATINVVAAPAGAAIPARLFTARAAGDAPYDLLHVGMSDTFMEQIFANNLVMPVTHPIIRDIIKPDENPWNIKSDISNVFGTQFGVNFLQLNYGRFLFSTMLFNRTFMERYSLGNFYEMVLNRTWTFESFDRILHQTTTATNGRVVPLSMIRESSLVPMFVKSNFGVLAEHDADGRLVFVGHENDNALFALNFLQEAFLQNHLQEFGDAPIAEQRFADGDSLFFASEYATLRRITQGELSSEYAFGLLPPPIGPAANEYRSSMHTAVLFYVINDIPNPREAAAILVAMANRLQRTNIIQEELYHGLQDEYSAEMLQILLDSVVVDMSRIHSDGRRLMAATGNNILRGSSAAASLQGIANRMNNYYNVLFTE